MPRFDFQCNDCLEEFDYLLVRSDDSPSCPRCGNVNLKKKVSLFAVGNSNVKAPPVKLQSQKQKKGHVCTSACNHGSSSKKSSETGLHVGCGRGYAETLRKKYGY